MGSTPEIESRFKEKGFDGLIKIKDKKIDSYSMNIPKASSGILILDKRLTLSIEQFAPFKSEDKTFKQYKELGIEIIDLNKDENRRKSFLNQQPQWLLEISSDKQEQEKYLKGRVQIKVIERMRLTLDAPKDNENTLGFWIPLDNDYI